MPTAATQTRVSKSSTPANKCLASSKTTIYIDMEDINIIYVHIYTILFVLKTSSFNTT